MKACCKGNIFTANMQMKAQINLKKEDKVVFIAPFASTIGIITNAAA